MLKSLMKGLLVCLSAAVISGCYNGAMDQASIQARVDFENKEAIREQQRQETVTAYREKFSYLAYRYNFRIYKTELNADKARVKIGQPIREFSILANSGKTVAFKFDAVDLSDEKPIDDNDLVYFGESNYGSEYDLKPEAQEKRPGSIEFNVDPNFPLARGRVFVSFKTRRTVGISIANIQPRLRSGYSTVVVGDFQLSLEPKAGSNSLREGKRAFVADAFFVEFDVSVTGKLDSNDVVAN